MLHSVVVSARSVVQPEKAERLPHGRRDIFRPRFSSISMRMKHEEISKILNQEVYNATAKLIEARAKLDCLISELPNEISGADKLRSISTAMSEREDARDALLLAVQRCSGFILNGIVPEDLKR